MSFQVTALPAALPDGWQDGETVAVDASPGYPCRRCLQDAAVGETVRLLAYDPFLGTSPYTGPGPVYVHDDCARAVVPVDELPEQQRTRLLSLRGYDERHHLAVATVVDGARAIASIEDLLAHREVDYLHVHNAGPGCFAVRIDRARPWGQPS